MTVVPIPMEGALTLASDVVEIPVLETLITIRHKLYALKKDRDSYIKPDVITALYRETEEQVERLTDLRTNEIWNSCARNRVNDVLDDVMSLLSLFFMSIGRNRESPAVYAQLVTIEVCRVQANIHTWRYLTDANQRYVDQLAQMGIYTDSILTEIEDRLKDVERIIFADTDRADVSRCFLDLLKQKLAQCKGSLSALLSTIHEVSPELYGYGCIALTLLIAHPRKPLHEELVALRRELAAVASRPQGFTAKDIYPFQDKLRHIDQDLPRGASKGQALVVGLLEHLHEETHDLIASTDNISESLMPIADRLKSIKAQLERLALTHKWTLRETDLYAFQLQLQEIEKLRTNGKFRDAESNVPDGQALINFLLRGCYRLMSKMLSENVPVSEALMPIHNQLSTVRRCLLEVTKWGKPDSARDLYPYQMKLASIENMRVNGIFYDDEGNIPEGQAICTALLNECYDILHDIVATIE
ncbi:hypothetical protein EC973_009200 [Apophysomyces ossiformis]|uniref:Uncharacterized protein n=1 Tax=Apophysomyces ossiformis TaxID=679940 RepID=A0A8H7EPP5_9FUNG|nr:hypothetical protein EC973_009200 [Apophysomyces ossiformis]